MADWLIPWRSRGRSGRDTDHFLWNDGRLYLMDNHRLALWCWWQHLDESERWTYFHIDRHFDAAWQNFNPWPSHTRPEHRSDLAAFRRATVAVDGNSFALYAWDTITTALWSMEGARLDEVLFATGDQGDAPQGLTAEHIDAEDLLGRLAALAADDTAPRPPCIIDIDIDYFVWRELDGTVGFRFADSQLAAIGQTLTAGLTNGRFGLVTIALSPETTGSWELAEQTLGVVFQSLATYQDFTDGAP